MTNTWLFTPLRADPLQCHSRSKVPTSFSRNWRKTFLLLRAAQGRSCKMGGKRALENLDQFSLRTLDKVKISNDWVNPVNPVFTFRDVIKAQKYLFRMVFYNTIFLYDGISLRRRSLSCEFWRNFVKVDTLCVFWRLLCTWSALVKKYCSLPQRVSIVPVSRLLINP